MLRHQFRELCIRDVAAAVVVGDTEFSADSSNTRGPTSLQSRTIQNIIDYTLQF